MLALPLILWACAAGYQVWVVETDEPSFIAPLSTMQAGYGFCHVCGKVLCGVHFSEHLTSEVPLGELEKA